MKFMKWEVKCSDCGKEATIILERKRLFRIVRKSKIISAWGYFGALESKGCYADIWECPECMLKDVTSEYYTDKKLHKTSMNALKEAMEEKAIPYEPNKNFITSVNDKSKGKVIRTTCTEKSNQ